MIWVRATSDVHRCLDCLPTAWTHWVVHILFPVRELLMCPGKFGDVLRQQELKHFGEVLCHVFDTIPPHEVKILVRYDVFPIEETTRHVFPHRLVHCQLHTACGLRACYLHLHLFEGKVVFDVFVCRVPSDEGAFDKVISLVIETLLKRAQSLPFPLNCMSLHPFKDQIHGGLPYKLFPAAQEICLRLFLP